MSNSLAGTVGQLRKGQMDPPARPVDSGMAKPQTWRSQLLPDTDADWTWMFPRILIQV